MATQQMRSSGGYAPLRVQRTFQAMDDGRGARAAALAESLGVILNVAPQIAKKEGDMAFEAGMRARVEGVQRENAKTTNKSMLGFMFSQRAKDGFDYQDAQIELPMIQMEEMLGMEAALRESRNPEDFRAYIAQRDEALKGRFEGKSEFYRFTVADSMMKMRGEQAKLFTQWVSANRGKDRAAAASAAAKATAAAQSAALESAQLAALEAARSGGPAAPTAAPTASAGLSMGSTVDAPQGGSTGLSMGTEVAPTGTSGSGIKGRGRRDGRGGRDSIGPNRSGQAQEGETLSFGTKGSDDLSFDLMEDAREAKVPQAFQPVDERQIVIDGFADFVKTAPQKFGVKPAEAKDLYIEGMVLEADRKNDERALELIPTEFLNFKQQDLVNKAIDNIRSERMSREAAEAEAAALDAKRELAVVEAEALNFETQLTMQLASGQMSKGEVVEQLFSNPYFKANPEERTKAIERLNKIDNVYVDPAMEEVTMSQFKDTAIRSALTGDLTSFNRAATEAITNVRSDAARQEIGKIVADSEKWVRDSLFKDLDPFYANITQAFPSGVGQAESLSTQLSGASKGKSYFAPTVDTDVRAMFESHLIGLSGDWYDANPEAGRMPYQVKWQLAQQASEMAIAMGQQKYGAPPGAGEPGTGDPSDAAKRLKERTGN